MSTIGGCICMDTVYVMGIRPNLKSSGESEMMISIIVPIYKVEEYLERCIQSILKQTYNEYELILVDDGSPDNCGEICDRYAEIDNRIKVIHKPNGGLSDARNVGLEMAGGEYVVFVDSDDWLAPQYLEHLLDVAKKTGSDIVECDIIKTSNENEIAVCESEYGSKCYKTEEALRLLVEDSVFHQYVWNKIYTREVIGNISFEKGRTNEDEFWTYQIFGRARKVARIDVPLYFYYQRESSIMGVGYNIKRLDGIEAKLRRQEYIEDNFPELTTVAKINLIGSCIYAGQVSLLYMDKNNQQFAKNIIDISRKRYQLSFCEMKDISLRAKIWFVLGRISFWGTCKLKNFLKKGL